MQRRSALAALGGLIATGPAVAHHGWSSFDQNRPLYLEGTVHRSRWRNPHAEAELDVVPGLKLPADLTSRALPAQAAPVDGPALLRAAQLPNRKDTRWTIEFAPLTRMEAWQVPEIKAGDRIAVLGFGFNGEKGDPVLRGEYLFFNGKVYGLRSSPA